MTPIKTPKRKILRRSGSRSFGPRSQLFLNLKWVRQWRTRVPGAWRNLNCFATLKASFWKERVMQRCCYGVCEISVGPEQAANPFAIPLFLIAASGHSVSQGMKRCFASQKQWGKNRFHWKHVHSGFKIIDMWNLGQRKEWESSGAETGTVICTVNWVQLSLAILLFSIVIEFLS